MKDTPVAKYPKLDEAVKTMATGTMLIGICLTVLIMELTMDIPDMSPYVAFLSVGISFVYMRYAGKRYEKEMFE